MSGLFVAFIVIHSIGMFGYLLVGGMLFFQNPDAYMISSDGVREERIKGKRLIVFALVWEIIAIPAALKNWRDVTNDENKLRIEEQKRTIREAKRIISRMKQDERLEWERKFNS